jgi:hypothetical protein
MVCGAGSARLDCAVEAPGQMSLQSADLSPAILLEDAHL